MVREPFNWLQGKNLLKTGMCLKIRFTASSGYRNAFVYRLGTVYRIYDSDGRSEEGEPDLSYASGSSRKIFESCL